MLSIIDIYVVFGSQGVTVEQVCRELRHLYVAKNVTSEFSISVSCELSSAANNEIHVAIVSDLAQNNPNKNYKLLFAIF